MTTIETAIFDDDYFDDPLTIGDYHRDRAAVVEATQPDGLPVWVITRYADAREALVDTRLSKDSALLASTIEGLLLRAGYGRRAPSRMLLPSMLFSDPPDHTRLRKLLAAEFTQRRIEALRPGFEARTAEVLSGLPRDEPFDLMARVAVPLPLDVICDLLGVPGDERGDLHGWTDLINEHDPETAPAASDALASYFSDLIERKRRVPGEDLVSALARGVGGDRLSRRELMGTLFLLINAGHDTTANTIGNTVRWLLADGGAAWRRVCERPELIPRAIEEAVRVDSPVRMLTHRVTKEDVKFGGITIPVDSIVFICAQTANRDPDRFDKADQFNLGREDIQHLSFGRGIHHCIGAPLARMEAQIVISALTCAFPNAHLDSTRPPVRRRSSIMGGCQHIWFSPSDLGTA